jgi:hypothetical protein
MMLTAASLILVFLFGTALGLWLRRKQAGQSVPADYLLDVFRNHEAQRQRDIEEREGRTQ